jgi:hypothetical protein
MDRQKRGRYLKFTVGIWRIGDIRREDAVRMQLCSKAIHAFLTCPSSFDAAGHHGGQLHFL